MLEKFYRKIKSFLILKFYFVNFIKRKINEQSDIRSNTSFSNFSNSISSININSFQDSFIRDSISMESDLIKANHSFDLSELDNFENFRNNYDDEDYNLNYTIELTRQELERRLKNESDYDMRMFCNLFFNF